MNHSVTQNQTLRLVPPARRIKRTGGARLKLMLFVVGAIGMATALAQAKQDPDTATAAGSSGRAYDRSSMKGASQELSSPVEGASSKRGRTTEKRSAFESREETRLSTLRGRR